MNKRIRKKKHRGEFAYQGFEVRALFRDPGDLDRATFSTTLADQFLDFCEANDMAFGGGLGGDPCPMVCGFVCGSRLGKRKRNGRRRIVECGLTGQHQQWVLAWLASRGALCACGPLAPAYDGRALDWPTWQNPPEALDGPEFAWGKP